MKFAFIIFKYFPFGGVQRDMLRTAQHLLNMGHQVDVFTLSWQGDVPAGLSVHVLPQKGWFNHQRYQKFIDVIFEKINTSDFDYVMGYNRMAGLDAHFAADPCFIERAHQQRHALYRLTPRYTWFAACEKAVFSADSNTEVLAVSEAEQPYFERWYGFQSNRFHFIPPFLSADRFVLEEKQTMRQHLRKVFDFPNDVFVFLLVGSGFVTKGLDRAIQALAAMPEGLRQRTRLVAVGQDKPKQFNQMAKKLGIAAQVVISKGRDDIPKLMQGADVYVHPAYRENTGLVILEAMACGLPVLTTANCGYANHVTKAEAGIVAELPFEQATFNRQWMQMWQALHQDESDLPAWGANGIAYVQDLMRVNDGSAEANILIQLAEQKQQMVVA